MKTINIQDEVMKIHHQFGTSEKANYEIQKLAESYATKKVQEERDRIEKWLMENSYCTNSKELVQFLFQQPEDKKVQKDGWISVKNPPENGIEIILQNDKWINEDYNPKGIRIGFKDDLSGWVSAYYCNDQDCYMTRVSNEDDLTFELSNGEDQIPTFWKSLSTKPKDLSNNKEE